VQSFIVHETSGDFLLPADAGSHEKANRSTPIVALAPSAARSRRWWLALRGPDGGL